MKVPRTRLSLEPTLQDKQDILDHGILVGGRSIIGSIRIAIRRSLALHLVQKKGKLMLDRKGKLEEVDL
jgi:hypothetical protein